MAELDEGRELTVNILHLNAGNETGGGMHHILSLLKQLNHERYILGLLEKQEMYKRAQDLGIRTVHFPHQIKWSPILLRQIRNFIRENNIKILHSHGPRANVYANILQRFVPIHWVVTVHSDPRKDFLGKGFYGKLLSFLNIHSLKNAQQVIAMSDPLEAYVRTLDVVEKKIICTYNGIDFYKKPRQRKTREMYGFTHKDFIFLMVGRLEKVKNHASAFKSFAQIIKGRKNCQLVLIGEGSQELELKRLATQLNIDRHVHFLGYHRHVNDFYEMADIKLLTSLSESFPLVLLEAARAKLPVIATDVGSVSRLLVNDSLGWLVQSNNVQELTKAMKEALSYKQHHLRQMGEQLYEHAKGNFSLENFANHMKEVYAQSITLLQSP